MKTEILEERKTIVWHPVDELNDPAHLEQILAEFKSSGMRTVLLDLTDKEWLSSSEIGVVMWIFKELENLQSSFCLLAPSPFVLKTITLTGIDQLMPIFSSREEAMNKIESSGN